MASPARGRVSLRLAIACLVLGAAVAFALSGAPPTASAGPSTSSTLAASDDAHVTAHDSSYCYTFVWVARVGTDQNVQTDLSYSASRWDSSTGSCVRAGSGHGLIPNDAYVVNGTVHTLVIDTRSIPTFQYFEGSGGVISLTWRKTSIWEESRTGSTTSRFQGWTYRTSGPVFQSSAAVSGTVLGVPIAELDLFGTWIGRSSQANLTFDRGG